MSVDALQKLSRLAAELVQCEPADTARIEHVAGEMLDVALSIENDAVRDKLISAANLLTSLIEGSGGPDAIANAGREIEAAMHLLEHVALAATPARADDIQKTGAAPSVAAGSLPADLDTEMLTDFLSEARENIQRAEGAILTLEQNPGDAEGINLIFRAFHTLKGMAGFLDFRIVADLAHHTESFMSKIRDGKIEYRVDHANAALASIDMMKELIEDIDRTARRPPDDRKLTKPLAYDGQISRLAALAEGRHVTPDGQPVDISFGMAATWTSAVPATRPTQMLSTQAGATTSARGAAAPADGAAPRGEAPAGAEDIHVIREAGAAPSMAAESVIRIRTERLDRLVNLIGELVISQSMVNQDGIVTMIENYDLLMKVEQVGKVVDELQTLSLSLRMIPLKATFQKMTRLVRDLSQKSRKHVSLVTAGEDTEIDRNMVEVINELLVHMVRNSVDHGIESPDARHAAGKSDTGTLRLSAGHNAGNVVFQIEDDGRGLDRDKILGKAFENGLIESEAGMTDDDIWKLIFKPGFSTAETVTDISGRGVGMDVVLRGIESLHGSIEIDNRPGKGCRFVIKVPLTMAITDGMVIRVENQRFILPTLNIKMSMQARPEDVSTVSGRGEMLRFMDGMLPVFRLHRLFELNANGKPLTDGLLVVVEHGTDQAAIHVDELLGQVKVVAKSLGDGIGRVPGISGGAVLGDGRVGLILDTPSLLSLARGSQKT